MSTNLNKILCKFFSEIFEILLTYLVRNLWMPLDTIFKWYMLAHFKDLLYNIPTLSYWYEMFWNLLKFIQCLNVHRIKVQTECICIQRYKWAELPNSVSIMIIVKVAVILNFYVVFKMCNGHFCWLYELASPAAEV